MANKLKIVGLLLLLILALVGWYVFFVQNPFIVARARIRYNQAVSQHIDLSAGPCLGQISSDWVLDIAHLPRQTVDDLPQNQCPDFLMGRVHHFIEMTPQGEVVVVQ